MLNLKKTAVAVLALSSSVAFAGTMGPVCSAVNVTVPCERQAWDFGVQALYLQQVDLGFSGNNKTGIVSITNGNTTTELSSVNALTGYNTEWDWGFKLEGSYHFSTGNDVNVNWYHYNNSNSSFVNLSQIPVFAFSDRNKSLGSFTDGSFSTDPEWDAVNFEFGQHVDFGEWKKIRFHGGAQYVHLENDATYSNLSFAATELLSAGTYAGQLSDSREFNGFGPRAGADMSYDWGNGFAMYANGAAALLVGKSKVSVTDTVGTTVANPVAITYNGSLTRIVPELELKLGAKYTYAMAQGDLTLDAGWMWVDYVNVFQSVLFAANDRQDFAVDGPFVGLKWVGSVV